MSSPNPNAESSKRKRSPSPESSTHKRPHFSDIFGGDDDKHKAQDEQVVAQLVASEVPLDTVSPLPLFISEVVVSTVLSVIVNGQSPISGKTISGILRDNVALRQVVEGCYQSQSFQEIRNNRTLLTHAIYTIDESELNFSGLPIRYEDHQSKYYLYVDCCPCSCATYSTLRPH